MVEVFMVLRETEDTNKTLKEDMRVEMEISFAMMLSM